MFVELQMFVEHKQYYRLPQKETDILNISKYLNAALGTDIDCETDDSSSDKDDSNNEDNDYDNNTASLSNITDDGDFNNNNIDSDNVEGML